MTHSNLCILPWAGIELTTRGKWTLCCRMSEEQAFGALPEKAQELFESSPYLKKIRQDFLEGKIPTECQGCFEEEKRGGQSYRQEMNQYFSKQFEVLLNQPQIRFLDVRFSNRCNFACRTCRPVASTGWAQDALMMGLPTGSSFTEALSKASKHEEETLEFLQSQTLPLEKIQIMGGEPFLIPAVYSFIERLIEQKKQNTALIFNTNMSTLICEGKDIVKLLSPFSQIRLIVSIDGLGKVNEYIRHGSKWDDLLANFLRLKKELPQAELILYPTVSLLNILSLSELLAYFLGRQLIDEKNVLLNILERPQYYSLANMPPLMKNVVKEDFQKLGKKHLLLQKQLQRVIHFFEAATFEEEHLQQFFQATKFLDQLRQESFEELCPKFRLFCP